MADKKISDFANASTLTKTELMEVVQGGSNKKIQIQDIVDVIDEEFDLSNIEENISMAIDEEFNLSNLAANLLAKENVSTGDVTGGVISINGGNAAHFDITAGYAIFADYTDPLNPTALRIPFGPFTDQTVTNIASQLVTYLGINSSGAIVQQASPFTNIQRRTIVSLGLVIHSNNTIINAVNHIVASGRSAANQLHDLMLAVGPLTESGCKYSANGANLNLDRSSGYLFKLGSNFHNDSNNPHQIAITSDTALTFRYRLRNSTEYSDVTAINPDNYDNAGVLTATPNNKFTIQRINLFQSGLTRIQYGQTLYDSMTEALAAIQSEAFITETNIAQNGVLRAYLIVKKGTTNLQTTTLALFIEVSKFGSTIGNAGTGINSANIISALGYTPENQANKATDLLTPDNTKYPTSLAIYDGLGIRNWSGTTTDATETEIFLNGVASSRLTVSANTSLAFDALVVGRNNAGNVSTLWKIRGIIKRDGSNNTVYVDDDVVLIGDELVTALATFSADNTNEALVIKVTGIAATTINWKVRAVICSV